MHVKLVKFLALPQGFCGHLTASLVSTCLHAQFRNTACTCLVSNARADQCRTLCRKECRIVWQVTGKLPGVMTACVLQTLCKYLPFDAAAVPCASQLKAEVVALLVLPIVSRFLPCSLIHILTAA